MKFKSNIEVQAGIEDKDGQVGSNGQILASTGSQVDWVDPANIVTSATDVIIECKNTSGVTIAKGTPVYQTGNVGATAVIEVAVADASDEDKMAAIGLLQSDLINNAFGYVVVTGELLNITTSPIDGVTPTTGDTIYVKPGGGLTLTKPTGVNFIQNVGLVGKVSGGNAGSLTVSSIMRSNDVPTPLYIDHDNQRLGIGTPTPGSVLDVQGTQGQLFSVTDDLSGEIFAVADISGVPIMTVNSSGLSTFAGNVSITKGVLSITSDGLNAVTFTESGSGDFTIDAPDDIRLDAGGGDIVLKSAGTEYGRISKSSSDLSITSSATDSDILINPNGNGNVGIGTTAPGAKLVISGGGGAISDNGFQINSSYGFNGTGVLEINPSATSHIPLSILSKNGQTANLVNVTSFGGTAGNLFNVQSSGNVGIGTTNPGAKLDVAGDIRTSSNFIADNATLGSLSLRISGTETGRLDNFNSALRLINFHASSETIVQGNGNISLNSVGSSNIKLSTANTERMRIDSDGNVGIGTTAPGEKLVIAGGVLAYGDTSSIGSGTSYYLGNNPNSRDIVFTRVANAELGIGRYNGGWYETMRFDADGNVGIGTTSPSKKLTVYGGNDNGIWVDSSGSQYTSIAWGNNGTEKANIAYDNTNANFVLSAYGASDTVFSNNGSEKMRIDSAGNVGIGTTSPQSGGGSAKWLSLNGTAAYSGGIVYTVNSATKAYSYFESDYLKQQAQSGFGQKFIVNGTTTAMTILSDGNATFSGNVAVNGTNVTVANASNPYIYINDTNAGAGIFQQEGNTTRIGSDSNTQVVLVQNNATAVTIDTDKNVGINTTSPDFKLDVDGTFGVSDLPFNTDSVSVLVANETIGADLVTNGDFATNTDWTEQGGAAAWSIANGKANCVVNSSTRYFEQPNVLPSSGPGNTYKVVYTISGITQGQFQINIGGYGATPGRTTNGTYAETFTTTNASANNRIYLQSSPNTIGSIDNISVQLVTSASNQIQKRELGTGAFGPTPVGAYLPLSAGSGEILTGDLAMNNNIGIITKDSSGAFRDILKLNSSNVLEIGSSSLATNTIFKNSGNVGIGTTTPGDALVVKGGSPGNIDLVSFQNNAGNETHRFYTDSANDGVIETVTNAGVTANLIQSSGNSYLNGGNVGINTTSPGDKLHVEGGIIIQNGNNLQWGGLYSAGAPTIYASTNYLHFVPTGSSGSGYRQMRLDTTGLGIGTSSPSEKLDVAGNIKIQAALLSNQENTDIDSAAAEVVAQVAHATYTAAFFDFVVKKGTNVRSGTVYACHNGDTTPLVEFTETSTNDLGDTSDVVLSVDISGANMRLLATVTSDDWSVKSLIRAI